MIYVFLANGFEETEAICPIDIMLRAGIEVELISVSDDLTVKGTHGIDIKADKTINDISLPCDTLELIMLPGGMPGTTNLYDCEALREAVTLAANKGIAIAAICAAPSILGKMGLLKGKTATCFEGYEFTLEGGNVTGGRVETDGNIITGKAVGTAIEFGIEIIRYFRGDGEADAIKCAMVCKE